MSAGQKSWNVRILAGGLAGAGLAGAGYRPLFIGGFSAPPLCGALIQSCGILGAVAVTLALFFAFGAAVGVATLPFEGEGRSVLLRSGLHFLVTAGLLGAILRVCLGVAWRYLPGWLALLGAIYLVVWLGRWVGWYADVRQLRSALGLEAGPSPLRWRESLPYLPVLLLVNALYLKNAWASEFDPLDTRPGDFTAADGSEAETDFLSNGLRAEQYFAAEGAAGVVLPYDDGRLGFLAVLPDGELDAWLETLDGDTLPALLAAAEEERVLLRLPKFEAEWGGELSDALAAMGLETAFDSGRADFSALGTAPDGPLYVSSVVHKARIEVNEKGTEAAAATVVEVEDAAAPTDYRELVLDRPFCYAVVDLERGVPLFLGTFERP